MTADYDETGQIEIDPETPRNTRIHPHIVAAVIISLTALGFAVSAFAMAWVSLGR